MITIEDNVKLRVLILSKDLSEKGGVVNFVRMLMAHSENNIEWEHFPIGSRGRLTGRFFGSCMAIRDSFLLAKKISLGRHDCIHINPSLDVKSLLRDGLFLLIIIILKFKNTIVFFHGWDKPTEAHLRNNRIFLTLFQKLLAFVPAIVVLGKYFKESLAEMGVSKEKIIFITNFFDGSIFKDVERKTGLIGENILFLSRFVKEKGVFETLEAFRLISMEFPGAKLILAGDGPERESMEKKIKEYGIENRVEFIGYVRDASKAQVLLDSDIFILPTYGEGCPVALLEAMAAGLPIITCPVGGIPDIFVDGKNGIFLSELSPSSIAYSIRYLFQSPDLRARIGENNKQYSWENLEAKIVTKKLERIYTELAVQNS